MECGGRIRRKDKIADVCTVYASGSHKRYYHQSCYIQSRNKLFEALGEKELDFSESKERAMNIVETIHYVATLPGERSCAMCGTELPAQSVKDNTYLCDFCFAALLRRQKELRENKNG